MAGPATVDPAAATALTAAEDDLATAKAASRATPSHLPLEQVRPGSRLLETEGKLLTHAIRMSAYNTESALARLIRPRHPSITATGWVPNGIFSITPKQALSSCNIRTWRASSALGRQLPDTTPPVYSGSH